MPNSTRRPHSKLAVMVQPWSLKLIVAGALAASACGDSTTSGGDNAQDSALPSVSDDPKSGVGDPKDSPTPDSGGDAEDPSTSPSVPPSGSASDDASEDDAGSDDAEPEPSAKFDLGVLPEGKEPPEQGIRPCEIDFLFVVDNSASMMTKQQNLARTVPKFVETMMTSTDMEKDFHIGVVTTDSYRENSASCRFLGGLVTQTKKLGEDMQRCGPFKSGLNFMTQDDDLERSFACAAMPGTMGDVTEKPIDAMRGAIAKNNGAKGKCNEGFMRDEALLVVVFITDEDDSFRASAGDPPQWHQDLMAAKGNDKKKVVVISIVVPPKPNECPPGDALNAEAERLIEFTEMFEDRNFVGDVCASSFDSAFNEAIKVVDFACGELHPPPG